MKGYSVLESAIIGLFVGVVVSTYETFLSSSGGFMGHILTWTSLRPLASAFKIPESGLMIFQFIFVVVVFVLYGIAVALILKKWPKAKFVIIPLIAIMLVAGFFEQRNGVSEAPVAILPILVHTVTVVQPKAPVKEEPQQYFGTEATGDLNGDGTNDVAFLISRKDPNRGALYYISAALTVPNGKQGTDLAFLGDKIEPISIRIENQVIILSVFDRSHSMASSTVASSTMYARVVGSQLETMTIKDPLNSLYWGQAATDGSKGIFEPCGYTEYSQLVGSSSVIKIIRAQAKVQTVSTTTSTSTLFAGLIGRIDEKPKKIASSTYKTVFQTENALIFATSTLCR